MANTQAKLAAAATGFMQRDPSVFVRTVGVTSSNLIPTGLTYAGGSLVITGLVIGVTYTWTKSTNDTSITCGTTTISSSGNFTATAVSATLAGTSAQSVTATLISTSTTLDLVLQACNNARLYAERMIDFELAVATVTVPSVDTFNGADLSTAVLYGTSTAVSIKKIMTPFLAMGDGTQFPVDLWDKKKWNDRLKSRYEGASPRDRKDYACITDSPFIVVQNGSKIFVAPADSNVVGGTQIVYLDAYLWLPPYVTGMENDFILDNCFDWLMYRCIHELNFFLKEDERVALSTKLMQESWDAMVKWNNELIKSAVDDVDLD